MEIALLIVRTIILIGLIGFLGTFIWGLITKWNMSSRITHLATSMVSMISKIVEIILVAKLKIQPNEGWVMALIIILLMALNSALNLLLISQKIADKYND